MLSLSQIKDKVKEMRIPYEKQIQSKTKVFYSKVNANLLYKDTVINEGINPVTLQNFSDKNKVKILKKVDRKVDRIDTEFKNFRKNLNYKKTLLNKYNVEYHERIALAFSCLVLFFIGAPLGSIIKKGGFGVPMISAILIFVIYYFIGVLANGMAASGKISIFLGGWLSTIVMMPLGALLIYQAVKDKSVFNLDAIFIPISNFFKKIVKSKKQKSIA
jgi:lipopolysaccharide export system permease protein